MTKDNGIVGWLVRIEAKVDGLIETNFTKTDMENFKRDLCAPSRQEQFDLEKRVQKTERYQARIGGIVAAITVIWGIIITLFGLRHGK